MSFPSETRFSLKHRSIICHSYEPVQAKVERNLLKQNVLREDPHDYMNRFGGQLFETEEVYRQARAYGIQDDLVRRKHIF